MKVLFLSRWCPHPVDNGSKIRVCNMLRCLSRHHDVNLVSFCEPDEKVAAEGLKSLGIRNARLVPFRPFRPLRSRALMGFASPTPRSIIDTRSKELEGALRQALAMTSYDVVIASQVWMASYRYCFSGIPAMFEEAELGMFRRANAARPSLLEGIQGRLTWEKHRRFMNRLVQEFALCTVASDLERALFREAAPSYKSVHVIPNAIDVESYERVKESRINGSLVFAGSLQYLPNYDGMNWFLGEVYPILRSKVTAVQLTITGQGADRVLPPAEGTIRTGALNDVRPVVAASAVSVAPIRVGGGTRLKVLEAMALRTPVVATSKAVEGLDIENETHLLVADEPREFADAIIQLLQEPWTARRLAENAFRLMKEKYDWKAVEPRWLSLVEEAAAA